MASHSTLPPDTLITAKITIGNQTRRFKLALRDLGANVLPNKLRELLVLPADQQVLFERYSDSAASYVTLDPKNPAVYKQLYRAAKAKLKLRIKATLIYPAEDNEVASGSSSINTERPFPPAYTSTTSLVPPAVVATPAVATPESETPVNLDVTPAQLDKAVADAVSSFLNGEEYLTKLRETVREEVERHEKEAPVPAPFTAEQTLSAPQTLPAELPSGLSHQSSKAPAFTYAIFCDSCEGNIYDVHYHCGICDRGDYDLCQACVDRGVHCKDSAHWLIKRTLSDGSIVTSVTESIKAKSPEPVEKETPVVTRTCNSCVDVLPENEFVSCVECDDYDICIPCHVNLRHGHHPRHEFAPATKETKLDPMATSLLAPGRNFRHYASCDGCDKQIYGVRHKCMNCPDWDYCAKCITTAPLSHHGHRFVPIYDPLPATGAMASRGSTVKHFGVYCDGPLCADKPRRSWIDGDRYKCAVCPDTDFCAGCEASPINPHNATHPLIKLKTPIRNVHVTTMEPDSQNPRVMGDGHYSPPAATSNAATQVQTVADVKPTEFEPIPEKAEEPEPVKPSIRGSVGEDLKPLEADFVHEVVQDGTIMTAGASFSQTWHLTNSGPSTWPAGVQPQFIAGDYMFEPELINATTIEHEVASGETVSFSVNLKAPLHARHHISYWRLTAPDGTRFGSKLWCDIQVVEPTKIEEPKVEPKAEEPKAEEPKAEEPKAEEPKVEEPKVEEPKVEEPKTEEPKTEEPKTEEPKVEEPAAEIKEEFEDFAESVIDNSEASSQMIFPRLPVESPVASVEDLSIARVEIESVSVPAGSVASGDTRSLQEDSDEEVDINSIADDLDSFMTDDEYDVLDASDEEAFQECERVV